MSLQSKGNSHDWPKRDGLEWKELLDQVEEEVVELVADHHIYMPFCSCVR